MKASSLDGDAVGKLAQIIEDSRSVTILGHRFPDGDAIGSALALAIMLDNRGLEVQASWPEPFELPAKYGFLPGRRFLVEPAELDRDGTFIVLDCANRSRLAELEGLLEGEGPVVNIDHHPDNSAFGDVDILEPTAAATAEILYAVSGPAGLAVNRGAAVCLYTGIVTDTGKFQFSNTTAGTLEAAAELVRLGVNPNEVFRNVYQSDSLAYLRLSGEILNNAVYMPEKGLIYAFISQGDLEKYGVEMNETEELIDSLRGLKGHRVAALFKELKGGKVRVSLRSRSDVDIGSVARRLGGGGHRVAAGYTSSQDGFEGALRELQKELTDA